MAKIDAFFNLMFEQKASDLHMTSGNPPMLRINGELQRVDYPPLENDSLKAMLYETAPDYKIKQFEETGDVDFGYEIPNISRFRVNFYNHRSGIAAAFRQIPSRVLTFEDFEKLEAPLPVVLKKFTMLHQGLVLVTPMAWSMYLLKRFAPRLLALLVRAGKRKTPKRTTFEFGASGSANLRSLTLPASQEPSATAQK